MFIQGFVSNPETIALILHCYLVIQNYSYWFWIRDKAGAPGHLLSQIFPGKSGWLSADLGHDLTLSVCNCSSGTVSKRTVSFPDRSARFGLMYSRKIVQPPV
jgi:hypothetical protein